MYSKEDELNQNWNDFANLITELGKQINTFERDRIFKYKYFLEALSAMNLYSELYKKNIVKRWTANWEEVKLYEEIGLKPTEKDIFNSFNKNIISRFTDRKSLRMLNYIIKNHTSISTFYLGNLLWRFDSVLQYSLILHPKDTEELLNNMIDASISKASDQNIIRTAQILFGFCRLLENKKNEIITISSYILKNIDKVNPKVLLIILGSFNYNKKGLSLELCKICHEKAQKLIDSPDTYNEAFAASYIVTNFSLPNKYKADPTIISKIISKINADHASPNCPYRMEIYTAFTLFESYPLETKELSKKYFSFAIDTLKKFEISDRISARHTDSIIEKIHEYSPPERLAEVRQTLENVMLKNINQEIRGHAVLVYAAYLGCNKTNYDAVEKIVENLIVYSDIDSAMYLLTLMLRKFSKNPGAVEGIKFVYKRLSTSPFYNRPLIQLLFWLMLKGHPEFEKITSNIWKKLATTKANLSTILDALTYTYPYICSPSSHSILYKNLLHILSPDEVYPIEALKIIAAFHYDLAKRGVPKKTIDSLTSFMYSRISINNLTTKSLEEPEKISKSIQEALSYSLYLPKEIYVKLSFHEKSRYLLKQDNMLAVLVNCAPFAELRPHIREWARNIVKFTPIINTKLYILLSIGQAKGILQKREQAIFQQYKAYFSQELNKTILTNDIETFMTMMNALFYDPMPNSSEILMFIDVFFIINFMNNSIFQNQTKSSDISIMPKLLLITL